MDDGRSFPPGSNFSRSVRELLLTVVVLSDFDVDDESQSMDLRERAADITALCSCTLYQYHGASPRYRDHRLRFLEGYDKNDEISHAIIRLHNEEQYEMIVECCHCQ